MRADICSLWSGYERIIGTYTGMQKSGKVDEVARCLLGQSQVAINTLDQTGCFYKSQTLRITSSGKRG